MKQLLLFADCESDILRRDFDKLKHSCDRSRKRQFAQINDIMKMYVDLKSDYEALKKAICKRELDI